MQDEREVKIELADMEEVLPIPCLNLLGIQEEKCLKPKDGGDYRVFLCKPAHRHTQSCPHCNNLTLSIHGYLSNRRLVHDVNVGVEMVDLLVQVPRYRCEKCGNTFTHVFESIVEKRQMTYRLYEQIKRDSFVRPFSDVSRDFGYSAPTIASIFDEYAAELEPRRGPVVAPRVLGIDEKHIVHAMRGVLVNIEDGTLLEMTAANKRADIIGAIESLVDYDKNIELVTMDMSQGYRSHVQECLPYAKIIVDKYHVYQDLAGKVRKTRTKLIEYLKEQIQKITLPEEKAHKQEVLNIAAANPYLFKFGQERLAEKESRLTAMADVCRTFPEFNHLRLLKEGFELIYACETRKEAETTFEEWRKLVPPRGSKQADIWGKKFNVPPELYSEFRTLERTIISWRNEIFTYFEPGCRVTNAATEGLNNLIERFNRMGNGYSFERLRAKALFWHLAAPRTRYSIEYRKTPVYKENATDAQFSPPFKTNYLVGFGAGFSPEPIGYNEEYHIIKEETRVVRDPLSVLLYLPNDYVPDD